MMNRYDKPTPKKWRRIGDAILLGSASLSTLMITAPFSDKVISITCWALGVIGVLGKILTNLAKENPQEDDTETIEEKKV